MRMRMRMRIRMSEEEKHELSRRTMNGLEYGGKVPLMGFGASEVDTNSETFIDFAIPLIGL